MKDLSSIISTAGKGSSSGLGYEVLISELEGDRVGFELFFSQATGHSLGQLEKGATDVLDLAGIFRECRLLSDRFRFVPGYDRALIDAPRQPVELLSAHPELLDQLMPGEAGDV